MINQSPELTQYLFFVLISALLIVGFACVYSIVRYLIKKIDKRIREMELPKVRLLQRGFQEAKFLIESAHKCMEDREWKEAYFKYRKADLKLSPYYHRKFFLHKTAKKVAMFKSVGSLLKIARAKMRDVLNIVQKHLNEEFHVAFEVVVHHFANQDLEKIESTVSKFFKFLREYEWAESSKTKAKFQRLIVLYWEEIFPQLVMHAEIYYEKKEFEKAKHMFIQCKKLVKNFQFGSSRSHLIQTFMKYERECDVPLVIVQILETLELSQKFIKEGEHNKALSSLATINSLEEKISHQSRDKKQFRTIHAKMNHMQGQIANGIVR